MNNITKVSQITASDVWEYLHPSESLDADNTATINTLIGIAKAFIQNYTGREDLDGFQDFVIVVLVLCQDMWDNRTFYVDKQELNFVVKSILDLHSVNLL